MSDDYSLHTVHVTLPPLERFAQFLKSRGKRVTQQRRLIVETIFSHHDHFDADELLVHLKDALDRREVSRPTVYRTLSEMAEAGILRQMELDGRRVYEHDYGYPHHDHLLCRACGELIEFRSEDLQRICDAVANEFGFEVASHRLIVTGTCRDCRKDSEAE